MAITCLSCLKCFFTKLILLILNVIVLCEAAALVLMGFAGNMAGGVFGGQVVPPAIIVTFMVVGGALGVVGALGLVYWLCSIRSLQKFYGIGLLVMTVFLAALSIYGFAKAIGVTDDMVKSQSKLMNKTRQFYNFSKQAKQTIDKTQQTFKCCGVENYKEWQHIYEYPQSCCPAEKVKRKACALADIYKVGCKQGALDLFHMIYKILYGVIMLFAVYTLTTGGIMVWLSTRRTGSNQEAAPFKEAGSSKEAATSDE